MYVLPDYDFEMIKYYMDEQPVFEEKTILSYKTNSLSLIRLIAAISVMYYHVIAHLDIIGLPAWFESTINYTFGFVYGVPTFFGISGFLIWKSIEKSESFTSYAKKRFWRIYPELWVAVIIEIASMLISCPETAEGGYKVAVFGATQGTIFQFWTPDALRVYGCGTPNGTLWTIGVMIQTYVVMYFLYRFLHGKAIWRWLLVFVVSVCASVSIIYMQEVVPEVIWKLAGQTFLPYLWLFLAGAFITDRYDSIIKWLRKLFWIPLALSFGAMYFGIDVHTHMYPVFRCVFLIIGLVGLAYAFPMLSIKTDISYGVFLYHMTVVNVMIQLGCKNDPLYLVIAMVISILLAWVSTVTVGKWSVRRKRAEQFGGK